jgi:hypothetical protein
LAFSAAWDALAAAVHTSSAHPRRRKDRRMR